MKKKTRIVPLQVLIVMAICLVLLPLSGCASAPETATSARSKEEKANSALLSIKMGGKLKGVTDKTKLNGPLVIPARVKEIGDKAFKGCIGLTEVDFSACIKLTEIGQFAFKNCTGLTGNLDLSACTSLTEIGFMAFKNCTGLTGVNLPANLTKMDGSIFDGCTNLHSLTVDPANQAYCSKDNIIYTKDMKTLVLAAKDITQVSIPDTVTEIGSYAFESCTGLTKLDLSACTNLISIGEGAFARCTGITELKLPENITHTGWAAFSGCTGLTSVDLSACTHLSKIGGAAFKGCTGLASINLSACTNLTAIGEWSFADCIALRELRLSAHIKTIGKDAFYNCTDLKKVDLSAYTKLMVISTNAFEECTGLTEVRFPANLTEIGKWAFYNCTALASVDLSLCKKLTAIGWLALPYSKTRFIVPTKTIKELVKSSYPRMKDNQITVKTGGF